MKRKIITICFILFGINNMAIAYCSGKTTFKRSCLSQLFSQDGVKFKLAFVDTSWTCKNGNKLFDASIRLLSDTGSIFAIRSAGSSIQTPANQYALTVNNNSFYVKNKLDASVQFVSDHQLQANIHASIVADEASNVKIPDVVFASTIVMDCQ